MSEQSRHEAQIANQLVEELNPEPLFVGREKEISLLHHCFEKTVSGKPHLVFVEGESGSGKTRLLQQFVTSLDTSRVLLLYGQGMDQTAHHPLHSLQDTLRTLKQFWDQDPRFLQEVKEKIGSHAQCLSEFIPELAKYFEGEDSASNEPVNLKGQRYINSLTAFLSSLADPLRPVLLVIDDCQWADELTLNLLQAWNSSQTVLAPVMIVALFRNDGIGEEHPLRATKPDLYLRLPRLEPKSLQKIAESMLGTLPSEVHVLIENLSEGNPLIASAVLRSLLETKTIKKVQERWHLDSLKFASIQTLQKTQDLLAHRIELLSESCIEVLSIGAVIGRSFPLKVIALISERSSDEIKTAMESAKQKGFLLEDRDQQLRFVHDKIREILLLKLSSGERRRIHEKIANWAENEVDKDPFFLAYHFSAADLNQKAFSYAMEAGTRSRQVYSLDLAKTYFNIAERSSRGYAPQVRCKIFLALGDVQTLRGRYSDANASLSRALHLASSPLETAEILARIGDLEFKRGNLQEATTALENGLRALSQEIPDQSRTLFFKVSWEVITQILHSLFPAILKLRQRRQPNPETRILSLLYSRLCYVYWYKKGKWYCAWAHLKNMNMMERWLPSPELAQVYSEHGPVCTMLPYFKRGLRYLRRSYSIRKEFGDQWGQAQTLGFIGVVQYSDSKYQQALETSLEAMNFLEKTGDPWETNNAALNHALTHYRLGNLDLAAQWAERIYNKAVVIGDHSSTSFALTVWALARFGKIQPELIDREMAKESQDIARNVKLSLTRGLQHIAESRLDDAIAALYRGVQLAEEVKIRNEYVVPLWSWLVTALRMKIQRCSFANREHGENLVQEATQVIKKALKLTKSYKNSRPHVLREAAYIAAINGKRKKAEKLLHQSMQIASIHGAKYELQLSESAREEIINGQFNDIDALYLRQENQLFELVNAQAKLQKAWVAAESASKAKSEFLASVSHELRTPLGAIMGFAELLLEKNLQQDPAETRSFLKIIHSNSEKLLTIINDILDLSKVEAGKMEASAKEFALLPEVQDVIQLFTKQAREKGIEVYSHVAPDVPATVFSDPLRVRQILLNLLGNSVKFTEHGSISVNIYKHYEGETRTKNFVYIEVIDTGIGISAEKRNELFKPFSQVSDSAARNMVGTGLGLSLCQRLARLIDGEVSLVASEPGKGSIFLFRFNAYLEVPQPPDVKPPKPSPKNISLVKESLL